MALDAHGPCEYNAPLFAGAGGLQGVRTAQHDIWGLRVPCKFNSRALPASPGGVRGNRPSMWDFWSITQNLLAN